MLSKIGVFKNKLMSKLCTRVMILFVLTSMSPAHANIKYFQYNGNLPFIEMMLNMMTVMGILDKVPVNYMSDIAYSRSNNYYPMMGVDPRTSNAYNNYPPRSLWRNPRIISPSPRCKSILCGNLSASLNGLWVAENGEMLGIKNHKFLWNDGSQQYLTGYLQARKGLMLVTLDRVGQSIQYKYKLNKNKLMMRDKNGLVKYFRRVRQRNSNY